MASDESSERRKPSYDDDDFEVPSIEKPRGNPTAILLVVGGVAALVLLLCLIGGGVVGFLGLRDQPSPDQFVGKWKGRIVLRGQALDTIYTFNKDGTMREDSFDLQGRRVQGGGGRWRIRNGEVEIEWGQGGGVEIATANFPNANTMNYQIIEHTDVAQIGMSTTFRRQ
jgi:hypothetical protein